MIIFKKKKKTVTEEGHLCVGGGSVWVCAPLHEW